MRNFSTVVWALLAALLSTPTLAEPAGAAKEKFTYTIRFATNQQGQPSSICDTPMCTGLKTLIDDATSSIDFAIYGLRGAPDIITALKDAVDRGVTVRGVVDTQTGSCTADDANFLYSDTDDLVNALGTSRVHCDESPYSYIMHHKFFRTYLELQPAVLFPRSRYLPTFPTETGVQLRHRGQRHGSALCQIDHLAHPLIFFVTPVFSTYQSCMKWPDPAKRDSDGLPIL